MGFCFNNSSVSMPIDILWKIANEEVTETESIYYCYYFLLMIFRNPIECLTNIYRISYNLEAITNLLFRLEGAIDEDQALWPINTMAIFKKFRRGLYLLSLSRIKQLGQLELQYDETQLQTIKNILKEDKEQNGK
eukprot:GHVR01103268.1.p1 GENE.GHVR01103268.1~~GHVR01103268.1.p1  ORF type:complete len:135 (+),score=3.34 GHVR01103268.1:1446-1850(+)